MKKIILDIQRKAGLKNTKIIRQLSQDVLGNRWLINTDKGEMVLSFKSELANRISLDISHQFDLLKFISKSGIAPEPFFLDIQNRVLLVNYIDGKNIHAFQLKQNEMLEEIANLFFQLHSIDSPTFLPYITIEKKLELYSSQVKNMKIDTILSRVKRLISGYSGGTQVICHNDVHRGNIIVGKKIAFIDWDYAGIGNLWFDLAAFIEQEKFSMKSRDYFLDAYFGSRASWSKEQLDDWLKIYQLVEKIWQYCIAAFNQRKSND
ncbi:MAG: aminoglycoside phosphotransferase family protein [Pseudomonadota bacterium]|nr:aminoglycoside phosphotransferase family protein [Pseudomonadota bacterium]